MVAETSGKAGNGSPSAPLEVLVIDANEDHQALSTLALGRHGYRVTAVDSGPEGIELATTHPFDAIVLSHRIRGALAFEVLQALVHRRPGVPKVFVVAPGAEDQVAKALAAGATGYLVKTARFNELLPLEVEAQIAKAAILARVAEQTRALADGIEERRKVEDALRVFEERIGVMAEQAPFILWTLDTDLRFTSSVGSGLRHIGLTSDQVNGLSLQEFVRSDDANLPLIVAHRQALGGETVRIEQEWAGRIFDVHVEPLRRKEGPVIGVFGIALDVTDRVRTLHGRTLSEAASPRG